MKVDRGKGLIGDLRFIREQGQSFCIKIFYAEEIRRKKWVIEESRTLYFNDDESKDIDFSPDLMVCSTSTPSIPWDGIQSVKS